MAFKLFDNNTLIKVCSVNDYLISWPTANLTVPPVAHQRFHKSANFVETMGFKFTLEYNCDLYLDTSKSINYENNLTIKSSFWVEKLTKYHPKMAKKA